MSKRPSKDEAQVTLAHGAFIGEKYVGPGEQVTVSRDYAATLTASGYVAGDEAGVIDGGADATASSA